MLLTSNLQKAHPHQLTLLEFQYLLVSLVVLLFLQGYSLMTYQMLGLQLLSSMGSRTWSREVQLQLIQQQHLVLFWKLEEFQQ